MKWKFIGAVFGFIGLAAPAATAQTLTINSWVPDKHNFTENFRDFAKEVEAATNGSLSFEIYPGASLLPVKGVLEGVSSGAADISNILAAYTPADHPINNMLNDLAFDATDLMVAAMTMTEISLLNETVTKEWTDNGVLFLTGWSQPVYNLGCAKKTTSLEDLKGKKIRTGGGSHVEWVKFVGGVPVSVPFGDVYSGIQRGSIDCAIMSPDNLGAGFQLAEVMEHFTYLPLGTHISGAQYLINPTTWKGFSDEQRKILWDKLAVALVRLQITYYGFIESGIALAKEHNVQFAQPEDSMVESLAEFKSDYLSSLATVTEDKRGINAALAQEIIDAYLATYAKWDMLLKDVENTDEAKLVALLKQEVFDKIDPNAYGL